LFQFAHEPQGKQRQTDGGHRKRRSCASAVDDERSNRQPRGLPDIKRRKEQAEPATASSAIARVGVYDGFSGARSGPWQKEARASIWALWSQ
jgi:hypothetical protein